MLKRSEPPACAHLSQLLSYVCYEPFPFGSHSRCTLWEQDMSKGCLRRKIDSSLCQNRCCHMCFEAVKIFRAI